MPLIVPGYFIATLLDTKEKKNSAIHHANLLLFLHHVLSGIRVGSSEESRCVPGVERVDR